MDKELDLEHLYLNYLKVTKQDPKRMGIAQHRETKRAFMAGIGNMLVILRKFAQPGKGISAAGVLAIVHLQHDEFWEKEVGDFNAKNN